MHSMFLFIHLSFSYIGTNSWLLPFDRLQEVYMELAKQRTELVTITAPKLNILVQNLVLWLSML